MTISPASDSPVDQTRVPERTLWFYRGRLQHRIYDLIVQEFYRQEDAGLVNRAALARRLNKRPEQITRWLAAPSNWTLDTISDLLVGLRVPPVLSVGGLPVIQPDVAQSATELSAISPDVGSGRGQSLDITIPAHSTGDSNLVPSTVYLSGTITGTSKLTLSGINAVRTSSPPNEREARGLLQSMRTPTANKPVGGPTSAARAA